MLHRGQKPQAGLVGFIGGPPEQVRARYRDRRR